MKNVKNIFIGAVGLLIGLSSCSDDFLKEKRDYNRMITADVFSDKTQASAVFATIYKQILSLEILLIGMNLVTILIISIIIIVILYSLLSI